MARPREFDVDDAIARATELFRQRGYHATSISDLTDALGILRGSLYKVFPDKHSLLLTVLDRYRIAQLDRLQRKLADAPTAVEGLRAVLLDWAEQASGGSGRKGCLITHLAQELVPGDPAVTDRIQRHFQQMDGFLADALDRVRAEGQLAPGVPVPSLANLLAACLQGMRITGKLGPHPTHSAEVALSLLRLLTAQSSTMAASA
jgi:AcrR family transcriptional regulator